MTNTEKRLRDEWTQKVYEEIPSVFIVNGEKEIADWWINKIAQERARIIEIINQKHREYMTKGMFKMRGVDEGCTPEEREHYIVGVDDFKADIMESIKNL